LTLTSSLRISVTAPNWARVGADTTRLGQRQPGPAGCWTSQRPRRGRGGPGATSSIAARTARIRRSEPRYGKVGQGAPDRSAGQPAPQTSRWSEGGNSGARQPARVTSSTVFMRQGCVVDEAILVAPRPEARILRACASYQFGQYTWRKSAESARRQPRGRSRSCRVHAGDKVVRSGEPYRSRTCSLSASSTDLGRRPAFAFDSATEVR